jgi:hypothetical protein
MSMRTFGFSVGKTLLQGAVEALMYAPLLLTLAVYALPGVNVWGWMLTLPPLFAAGYAISAYLPWRKLLLTYLLAIVLGVTHAYFVVGTGVPLWWLSVPIGCIVAYRGSRLTEEEWHLYFPPGFYIIGMVLYGIISLFGPRLAGIAPYMPDILWGGLLSLAVTLLMVNQSNVKQEAYATVKNSSLSKAVIWQNRLFVLGLFGAVLLVAFFQSIERGISWLFQLIVYIIAGLLALLVSAAPDMPEEPPSDRLVPRVGGEQADHSWWWELLQRIGIWISYTLIAIVAAVMLYIVVKRLIRLLKWLYRWLLSVVSKHSANSGDAYEDDVETIVTWDELSGRWAAGLSRMFRRDKRLSWGDLTDNRERIRFLYGSLLLRSTRRGYGFKAHLTPAETERDLKQWSQSASAGEEGGFVELYERVRYGGKQVSDEEVAKAKDALDKQ